MAPPDLDRLREHADRSGVFLDFDGTMSEIAPNPEAARPVEGLGAVLERLASRYRVVAAVSGRPAAEVASLVGGAIHVFGLYGLEDERGPGRGAQGRLAVVARALPEIERAAGYVPGSRIERKGLSVAIHYRAAPEPGLARRVLLERLAGAAERFGLEVIEGKRVVELVAGPRPRKGEVIERVVRQEGLRYVLYAGDDLADLDAFDVLDALEAEGVEGVRVAVRSNETPDALVERADVVVEGPAGLLRLLDGLAR